MSLFDSLDWRDDHFLLAGRTFRLQHQAAESTSDDAFLFYKHRAQLEQFDRFLTEAAFTPRRVLELGIWDGGSAAFWTEVLDLERYSAIDLQHRGDSDYFRSWREERGRDRVQTYWGVSQTDGPVLRDIVAKDGLTPLDLVLDDCSHHYAPTLESFEMLFGLVRPGGFYVIEDWAWALQPEFQQRAHPWGVFPPLHPVVHRLIDLHGTRPDVVASLRIFPEFIAVERGPAAFTRADVEGWTAHRPKQTVRVAQRRARSLAGTIKRRLTA